MHLGTKPTSWCERLTQLVPCSHCSIALAATPSAASLHKRTDHLKFTNGKVFRCACCAYRGAKTALFPYMKCLLVNSLCRTCLAGMCSVAARHNVRHTIPHRTVTDMHEVPPASELTCFSHMLRSNEAYGSEGAAFCRPTCMQLQC